MPKRLSNTEKQYQIYALLDPRDHGVRYVGMSDDAEYRFYQHTLRLGVRRQERNWLDELQQLGLAPVFQIIESVQPNTFDMACEREKFWIEHLFNQGHALFNRFGVDKAYPQYDYTPRNAKVKALRIKAALNVSRLSSLSGVSFPTIEKMEKGDAVRADLASAVCRALTQKLGYEITIENAEINIL